MILKEFFLIIKQLIREFEQQRKYEDATIEQMKSVYENMTDREQEECLKILADVFGESCEYAIYMLSMLLINLHDKKIVPYIEKKLESNELPIWNKFANIYQMKSWLFSNALSDDSVASYKNEKRVYTKMMDEFRKELGLTNKYIPYKNRKKTVIIIVNQFINVRHAPTSRTISICNYLKKLGYEVYIYVSFYSGTDGICDFYSVYQYNNFNNEAGIFYDDEMGAKIYNIILKPLTYISDIKDAVKRIWDTAPEYVFELGTYTLLADLCRDFTTVVTSGFSIEVPITNAPIIATCFRCSAEEKEHFKRCLEDDQIVVELQYRDENMFVRQKSVHLNKIDLKIPETSFTIIIAGNRLDTEIKNSFLEILYQILDKNIHIVIAFIGKCKDLQSRIKKEYSERMFFWVLLLFLEKQLELVIFF